MELLRGRIILCGALFFALAAVLAWFWHGVWIFSVISVLIMAAAAFTAIKFRKKKISRYRFVSVETVFILCLCFLLRLTVFYCIETDRALALCGSGRDVTFTVTERGYTGTYSSRFYGEVTSSDSEESKTKAVLYVPFSASFCPGDVLNISDATVRDSKEEWYGYAADGYRLYISADSADLLEITGFDEDKKEGRLTQMRRLLSYKLKNSVKGKAGGLCAAMLLGDSDSVDDSVKLAFRRAGVSHLLAVSGMHMSVAAAAVSGLFKKLKLPRGIRTGTIALVLLSYLCLLGFPVSAMRSVSMLMLSYAGFFAGFDTDGLTSLGISLMLILFLSPAAIADSGFILSFSATFGILAFSPLCRDLPDKYRTGRKLTRNRGQYIRAYKKIFDRIVIEFLYRGLPTLLTAVSVNIMTAVPVSLLYGEFSLFTPLSNLFFPLLASPVLVLSALVLLFYGSFAAPFLSRITALCVDCMIKAAEKISDIRGVTVSLGHRFVLPVLTAALILTLVLLSAKLRHPALTLAPAAVSLLILVFMYGFFLPDTLDVFYTGGGTSETLTAVKREECIICDLSSGSYTALYEAFKIAGEAGATETVALIFTHYHTGHAAALMRLASQKKIRQVWLPVPVTSDDAANALRIYEVAGLCGAECRLYSDYEELRAFGDVKLTFPGISRLSRSSHPVIYFELERNGKKLLYLGKACWESTDLLLPVPDGDTTVILGGHGPKLKECCPLALTAAKILNCFENCEYACWFGNSVNRPLSGLPPVCVYEKTMYFAFE